MLRGTVVYLKNVDIPEGLSRGEKAKAVSIKGHELLRHLISALTGEDYSRTPFSYSPAGKPYFPDCPLRFSLSHSGSEAAVAISESEVGVDIEEIGRFSSGVARRVFTSAELEFYEAGENEEERSLRGFCIWTAKEAYLKLHGVGITGGFDFDTAESSGMSVRITSGKYPAAELKSSLMDIVMDNGAVKSFSIALCGYGFSDCPVDYHVI